MKIANFMQGSTAEIQNGALYQHKSLGGLYRVVAAGLCVERGILVVIYTPINLNAYCTMSIDKFVSEFAPAKPLERTSCV